MCLPHTSAGYGAVSSPAAGTGNKQVREFRASRTRDPERRVTHKGSAESASSVDLGSRPLAYQPLAVLVAIWDFLALFEHVAFGVPSPAWCPCHGVRFLSQTVTSPASKASRTPPPS